MNVNVLIALNLQLQLDSFWLEHCLERLLLELIRSNEEMSN